MLIESTENKRIKDVIKLRNKKYRDEMGLFVVETEHLVEEAYKKGILKCIYKLYEYKTNIDVQVFDVSLEVMKKMTELVNSKVIGVCEIPNSNEIIGNKILMLDNVQDPGNIGTIIRSSLGFNIDTIIFGKGTCDIYNEKVLRASEGAIFHINVIRMDLLDAINKIKYMQIPIYGTDVNDGVDVREIKDNKYAIIMGNEGAGVNKLYLEKVDKKIYIKTNTKLESLNVGVASSIILYELNKNN